MLVEKEFWMAAMEKELRVWRSNLEAEFAHLNAECDKLLGKMSKIRQQIDAIDRLLPDSEEKQQGSWKQKVEIAKPGESFTPVHSYWRFILQSLVELGGSARSELVLERVGQKMEHILTAGDRAMLPSGVDVRWKNRAAWQRYNMVRQGLLKNNSPRGIWEISEQGKRWLEETGKQVAQK